MLTLATIPLWLAALAVVPGLAWIFIGLGMIAAVLLALAALSASIHGVAQEAGAMWQPLFGWLPAGLRTNLFVRLACGFLACIVLNVSLHWLWR